MKDSLKLWVIGAVAASVLLLAGGYFVGVQPMLASAQIANASSTNSQMQTQTLRVQLAGLRAEDANKAAVEAEAAAAEAATPATLALPSFLDEVTTTAAANSVTVSGITPGVAQAYSPPASTATAATTSTTSTSATPTPTPTASAAATTAPVVATVAAQSAVDPTITASNFVALPMSVAISGSSANVLAFTHAMQNGARTFLINGVSTVSNAASAGSYTATLTGFVYSLQG